MKGQGYLASGSEQMRWGRYLSQVNKWAESGVLSVPQSKKFWGMLLKHSWKTRPTAGRSGEVVYLAWTKGSDTLTIEIDREGGYQWLLSDGKTIDGSEDALDALPESVINRLQTFGCMGTQVDSAPVPVGRRLWHLLCSLTYQAGWKIGEMSELKCAENKHCDHWQEGDGPCCCCQADEHTDNDGICRHVVIEDNVCTWCKQKE